MILLSDRGIDLIDKLFTKKFGHITQAPNYYYTTKVLLTKRNKPNLIYKALRVSKGKELDFKGISENSNVQKVIENRDKFTGILSKLCLSVFEGKKDNKGICRTLDNLIYGQFISENSDEIMNEIDKYGL